MTGSNGKTTTKEMIAAVLGARGAKVAKSAGNENNLVGRTADALPPRRGRSLRGRRDGHEPSGRDLATGGDRASRRRRDHERRTRAPRGARLARERRGGQGRDRARARTRRDARRERRRSAARRDRPSASPDGRSWPAPTACARSRARRARPASGSRSRSTTSRVSVELAIAARTTWRTRSRCGRGSRLRARRRCDCRRARALSPAADEAGDRHTGERGPRAERRVQRQPSVHGGRARGAGERARQPTVSRCSARCSS